MIEISLDFRGAALRSQALVTCIRLRKKQCLARCKKRKKPSRDTREIQPLLVARTIDTVCQWMCAFIAGLVPPCPRTNSLQSCPFDPCMHSSMHALTGLPHVIRVTIESQVCVVSLVALLPLRHTPVSYERAVVMLLFKDIK